MIPILSLVKGIRRERILNHQETRTNAKPGLAIEIQDDSEPCGEMLKAEGSGLFPYQRAGPLFLTESAGLYNQNQLIVNAN